MVISVGEYFSTWLKRDFAATRGPGPEPRRCSRLGCSSPSTALRTAGAGACLTAVSPSRHHCERSPLRSREVGLRTGIAAGHQPAPDLRGHCADPPGYHPWLARLLTVALVMSYAALVSKMVIDRPMLHIVNQWGRRTLRTVAVTAVEPGPCEVQLLTRDGRRHVALAVQGQSVAPGG